jgi:hypothetical protein
VDKRVLDIRVDMTPERQARLRAVAHEIGDILLVKTEGPSEALIVLDSVVKAVTKVAGGPDSEFIAVVELPDDKEV